VALQNDANAVIMSPADIEQFNVNVRKKQVVFSDYYGKEDPLRENYFTSSANGLVMNLLQPLELPDSVPGDSVKVRLVKNAELLTNPVPLYGSTDFYDDRNSIYDARMKDDIIRKMNMDGIPSVIKRRFGIIVNHYILSSETPAHLQGKASRL
jgi:hypothetical protein